MHELIQEISELLTLLTIPNLWGVILGDIQQHSSIKNIKNIKSTRMVTGTYPTIQQGKKKAFLIYCSPKLYPDSSLFKEISSERQNGKSIRLTHSQLG